MTSKPTRPEQWLDQYGDALFQYALSRLRNRDAAEEVVQETLVAAIKHQDQFSGKGSEGAWLMGIHKRKVIDHIRQSLREKPVTSLTNDRSLDQFFDENGRWSEKLRKGGGKRLDAIESSELWTIFQICLDGLPQNQSRVFVLREIDEQKSPDICKDLGITSTNLWVLLHRARIRLAECVKARWGT